MSKLGNPIPPKKFEFVGASARSRTGCINCRLRKKKCDEVKPKCGLCSSRGSDCDWKGQQNEGNNKRKHEEVVQATAESLLKITGKRSNGFEIVTPRKSDVSLADKLGNPTFSFELQNLFTIPVADISNITTTSAINSDLRSTSKSSDHSVTSHGYFFRLSSEKEKVYLEKYISIAQSMSVAGIRNNNSYLSVYLPLANKNQCVLKSLLTWGSMAVEGSNQLFMKETLHSIQTYRQSVTSREQYVFVLASYLILLDAEVTQGDTKRWPLLLENAMTVCQEMGLYNDALDIVKINYINETEKWLILNLIHHDLFSSQACIRGTFLPPSTLLQFSNEKQGTDTLQGCIRPFLVLLSEAINLSIEAKDKYKLLKDSKKMNNYKTTAVMNRIHDMALDLDARMTTSKPQIEDLHYIPKEFLEPHLSLYELIQFSSQIFLRISVRRYGTNVPEIQVLLYKVINLLIFLVTSEVKAAMKFPFLIAGISCVYQCDKIKVMSLLDQYEKNLDHLNIGRVKKVIQDVWERNPDGLLCLDWNEIVNEFGWELCLT